MALAVVHMTLQAPTRQSCCVSMQVVAYGVLQATDSQTSSAWQADFRNAVSAVYLAHTPSMRTTMSQALLDSLSSSPLDCIKVHNIDTVATSTSDMTTLLAHTQRMSDQPVSTQELSEEQKHGMLIGPVLHPGRVVRAAWAEAPNRNSILPLPSPELDDSSALIGTKIAESANQHQECIAPEKSLAETLHAFTR